MSFLEALENDNNLLDYSKSDKAFAIVLQVVDNLLKHSTRINDGFYRIKLCTEEYVS